MSWARKNNRTAGRYQPVVALCLWQTRNRPGRGIALCDAPKQVEVRQNTLHVALRIKHLQALNSTMNRCRQKSFGATIQDDAHIDAFTTL
jgi:hypothetical protein